jgi:hypothetical protein
LSTTRPGIDYPTATRRIRDLETEIMSGREYIEILRPPRAPVRGRLDESAPPGLQLMCNHVNEWALTTDIRRDIDGVVPRGVV